MKNLRQWGFALIALFFMGFAIQAHAAEAPDELIRRVSKDVMDAAKGNKEIKKGNMKQIYRLVQSKIFPHVDFQRMTSMATGRFWRQATDSQKKQLTKEFSDLLVHTYAGAISKIDNQRMEVKKTRMAANATDVIVHSRIIQPRGGDPITVSYRLAKTGDQWKIYDMSVLGAWIVASYKNTFTNEINRSGIDGLIKMLANKNKSLAAKANKGAKR